MTIVYYLKDAPAEAAAPEGGGAGGRGRGGAGFGGIRCAADGGDGSRPFLTIADAAGKTVCTLVPPSRQGINRVVWPLAGYAPQADGGGGGGRGGNGRGGGLAAPAATAGEYTFTLHAGGRSYTQKARLISRAAGEMR
jgi:hypothetical protein